jgi:hypothetical protein
MIEKAWYELSPMIYFVTSGLIIFYSNALAAFFAILLFLASVLIGMMRFQSRSKSGFSGKNKKLQRPYPSRYF